MRLILFLLAASLAAAFVIPDNLPDGMWNVFLPEDDEAQPKLVKRADLSGELDMDDMVNQTQTTSTLPYAYRPEITAPPAPTIFPLSPKMNSSMKNGKITGYKCVFREPRVTATEYALARNWLMMYCDRYLVPGETAHIAMAKTGDTIVYACNWGKEPQACRASEFILGEQDWLDPHCGELTTGYFILKKVKRTYGRAWTGSQICQSDVYGQSWPKVYRDFWIDMPVESRRELGVPGNWPKQAEDGGDVPSPPAAVEEPYDDYGDGEELDNEDGRKTRKWMRKRDEGYRRKRRNRMRKSDEDDGGEEPEDQDGGVDDGEEPEDMDGGVEDLIEKDDLGDPTIYLDSAT